MLITKSIGSSIIPSWTRVQRIQIVPKLLAKQVVSPSVGINLVITLACLYTYDNIYLVLSIGRIDRTQHLPHVVLSSFINNSHSSLKFYYIDYLSVYPVFSCNILEIGHCIQLSQHSVYHVQSISLLYCFVQLYINSTLL